MIDYAPQSLRRAALRSVPWKTGWLFTDTSGTRYAQARMAEHRISEAEVLLVIETGDVLNSGPTRAWI